VEAVASLPQTSAKAVSAEFESTLQLAEGAASPQKTMSRVFMASNGMMRVDTGNTSIITDPVKHQTITLDHLKKEARIHEPAPPPLPKLEAPHMDLPKPQVDVVPPAKPISVKDLGKRWLQGYEVHGKEYVFPPVKMPEAPSAPGGAAMPGAPAAPKLPNAPKAPELPKLPGLDKASALAKPPALSKELAKDLPKTPDVPKIPGVPKSADVAKAPDVSKAPEAPKPPAAPPINTVTEVWTSPLLNLPMLTRTKGTFGQLISHCKRAIPGEPPPSVFQIPPEYKTFQGPSGIPSGPAGPALKA
jgi:hypothetical protein